MVVGGRAAPPKRSTRLGFLRWEYCEWQLEKSPFPAQHLHNAALLPGAENAQTGPSVGFPVRIY